MARLTVIAVVVLTVCALLACAPMTTHIFRVDKADGQVGVRGYSLKVDMMNHRDIVRFPPNHLDNFSLRIKFTRDKPKGQTRFEDVTIDTATISAISGEWSTPLRPHTQVWLSYSSENKLVKDISLSPDTNTWGFNVPPTFDTLLLEFDVISTEGELAETVRYKTVRFDSIAVAENAPRQRTPVRIRLYRQYSKQLAPYFTSDSAKAR